MIKIIIQELEKIHGKYMVAKAKATINGEYYKNQDEWRIKFFKPFAKNLLAKIKKDGAEEIRLRKRMADSASRGMSRMKNEELQDMKIQFKNIQGGVGKLQKENKKLRRGIIEVFIKKDGKDYVIHDEIYHIATQGSSIEEVKKMYNEAFILYMETRIDLNTMFQYKY